VGYFPVFVLYLFLFLGAFTASALETLKPSRNFRFKNKKEIFAIVGFRYDQPSSLSYLQRVNPESIAAEVLSLLKDAGADVISIRRVYLDHELPDIHSEPKLTAIPQTVEPPLTPLGSQ